MSEKKQRKKANEKEDGEWKCLECSKSYLSYPAFYTHCKTKHESKWPKLYSTPRPLDDIKRDKNKPRVCIHSNQTNMDEQKQHEREDQIFEFLGKLGQNNEEEDSTNNFIRHYLKQPIDPVKSLSDDIFKDTVFKDFFGQIMTELEDLNKKVLEQEAIWDFRDPLTQVNELDEFTFSNLKGIFHQLQGKLTLINSVAIFLGWLSRHLKKNGYQDVTIIVIIATYFLSNYHQMKSQDVKVEGKLDLMQLEENGGDQQDDQKKKQLEYNQIDKQNDTDLKKEVLSQVNNFIKKEYPRMLPHLTIIKTADIAHAFFCLMIEWFEAFLDLEEILAK